MPDPDPMPPTEPELGGWTDDIRVAAAFLTRLPVPMREPAWPRRLGRAAWAFPVIGAGIGAAGGLAYAAGMALGLMPQLSAILAVGAQVLLSGALHEDAAGDVADGFGGGATREQKLEIMRDSRVGTYAVVTLVLILAARIAALSALAGPEVVVAALIAAAAASRAFMVPVMAVLAPARSEGLGAGAGRPGAYRALAAIAIAAAVCLAAMGIGPGAAALAGAAAGAAAVAWLAQRQIKGQTGDVLGACQQAGEIVCLMALVAVLA